MLCDETDDFVAKWTEESFISNVLPDNNFAYHEIQLKMFEKSEIELIKKLFCGLTGDNG
jgi:hypothetical protein